MPRKFLWIITSILILLITGPARSNEANFLFYSASTGAGAIGTLSGNEFVTISVYPAASFATWTHVANVDGSRKLLFYNAATGAGADGTLSSGSFVGNRTYNLGTGWTHIVNGHLHHQTVSLPLFYDAARGTGSVGYAPTIRSYPAGAFATGWTHIAAGYPGILFYNARTGAGAIAVPIDSSPTNLLNIDDLRTVAIYDPGSFAKNWTHVVPVGGAILFYNASTGSRAVGRLTPNLVAGATDFQTDTVYPAGTFPAGWTHIVAAAGSNKVLFYNSGTGAGAIGEVSAGQFSATRDYAPGTFATGWTHIVAASP